MTRKGLSQVLALIVAASVLMMTALALIMLTQGTIVDFGQTNTRQACVASIESQCGATGSTSVISAPGTCVSGGNVVSGVDRSLVYEDGGEIVADCGQVNN